VAGARGESHVEGIGMSHLRAGEGMEDAQEVKNDGAAGEHEP
jgi:hypothetical protein